MEKYPLEATRHLPTLREQLPDEIMALVGSQDNTSEPEVLDEHARQADVLRRFAETFQTELTRLTSIPALPAIATIRLDDPWA